MGTVTPDQIVWWEQGWFRLSATLVFTWVVMVFLVAGSHWITRRLRVEGPRGRGQQLLEIVLGFTRDQLEEICGEEARRVLPFVATLFLFIAVANALAVVPGFIPPTASLSTTTALALCVLVAVPVFGIARSGWRPYLKRYLKPSPLMLPFNLVGELSRTLALAVRLFGNVMSGAKIAAILLAVTPLVFPVVMTLFGLLTGLIQAYIFAVLAAVYISSGMAAAESRSDSGDAPRRGSSS